MHDFSGIASTNLTTKSLVVRLGVPLQLAYGSVPFEVNLPVPYAIGVGQPPANLSLTSHGVPRSLPLAQLLSALAKFAATGGLVGSLRSAETPGVTANPPLPQLTVSIATLDCERICSELLPLGSENCC